MQGRQQGERVVRHALLNGLHLQHLCALSVAALCAAAPCPVRLRCIVAASDSALPVKQLHLLRGEASRLRHALRGLQLAATFTCHTSFGSALGRALGPDTANMLLVPSSLVVITYAPRNTHVSQHRKMAALVFWTKILFSAMGHESRADSKVGASSGRFTASTSAHWPCRCTSGTFLMNCALIKHLIRGLVHELVSCIGVQCHQTLRTADGVECCES